MRNVPSKLNREAGAGPAIGFDEGLRLSIQASKYGVVSDRESANWPREESFRKDSLVETVDDSGAGISSPLVRSGLLLVAVFLFQHPAITIKHGARLQC